MTLPKRLPRTAVLLLPVAVAALLSGCKMFHKQDAGTNLRPAITVKNGEIDIQPPVLRYRKSEGPVTITWHLAARDGVTLADPAVVIEDPQRVKATPEGDLAKLCPKGYDAPEGVFNCAPGAKAGEYSCKNANAKPGCYKYTFRLMVNGKLVEKDPPIINFMD